MPLSQYILFFKPIVFFDLIWMFLLVDIENNYLILCQLGYFFYLVYRFWDIWIQGFNGLTLTFDFWSLEVTWGQKYFQNENPYMTSNLTSIDTFSLSRTVFEILELKVFRVWPWPLTLRGHLESKIFPPFESPYMTSYLTSNDTFSLSRTVFEIFDFKVLRVWPWPLTCRGHPRSKILFLFESPYMTSYLTSTDTFYLVPFSRYSTSKFLGFDLNLCPLGVTWSQKYSHHLKAHIWLTI